MDKDLIMKILTRFNINIEDITETHSNSFTLYTLRLGLNAHISQITVLRDEIAFALGNPHIRIGALGIEVPNRECDNISIQEILNSQDFRDSMLVLPCALGKTISGTIFIRDLTQMGHLLIGGEHGSGITTCLKDLLLSLICKRSPDEMRLILIDSTGCELSVFSKLTGSYLAAPAVTDAISAYQILSALCQLADERFSKLKMANVRNIIEYNAIVEEKMPYVVVVINEYAELMMDVGKEIEDAIINLAERNMTVGIHLIISTSRLSHKFVTGYIKANFPARIAFETLTCAESRMILDRLGAENLLSHGVMIYNCGTDLIRVQCALATDDDINNIVNGISDKYQSHQYGGLLPEPQTNI